MSKKEIDVAVLLHGHCDIDVVKDTLDSINKFVSSDVLLLLDGAFYNHYDSVDLSVPKLCGFVHNVPKSPYRNVALGLNFLYDTYPNANWYLYTEYDVLFTSDRFKRNLRIADERGVWMIGNDGHMDEREIPMLESMLGAKINSYYYLLGCCQFFSKSFMVKLKEIDFFDRFLSLTNGFDGGTFPGYSGYDISETMYPSLCRFFGGNIGVFASYDENQKWHGSYQMFPMRWRPELDFDTENFPEMSIAHPLKQFDHPIREYHRRKRA